jgi:hypothetical protein
LIFLNPFLDGSGFNEIYFQNKEVYFMQIVPITEKEKQFARSEVDEARAHSESLQKAKV